MKRYAFFPGCLIPARHPAMEFAIRSTLPNLGIEIVDLEGASCCPDPIYFKSKDKLSWLTVAARNLTLAEDLGLDIFTNCSGCTATLSETYHLLEDEELRHQVNRRLARIAAFVAQKQITDCIAERCQSQLLRPVEQQATRYDVLLRQGLSIHATGGGSTDGCELHMPRPQTSLVNMPGQLNPGHRHTVKTVRRLH